MSAALHVVVVSSVSFSDMILIMRFGWRPVYGAAEGPTSAFQSSWRVAAPVWDSTWRIMQSQPPLALFLQHILVMREVRLVIPLGK